MSNKYEPDTLGLTRELLSSVLSRADYTVIGNAPLDDGGIDFVISKKDGPAVIAMIAVEIDHLGDAQLREHPTYGMQLSDRWIAACIEAQPQQSVVRSVLRDAVDNLKLTKAIGGVDKKTGNVVLTPVNVE
ncbi:hypothetical protein WBP06_27760 [Novosphingobium sp. BL-8H]|uniref:hypothetical protein n=1 Tax=Novosphingobium sp. BL-8H TaxID=3127640 RepID=UPI003757A6FF